MNKPRIIFDRSAFHGDNFDKLIQSPLLRLARTRHVSIYHAATLIEETASLYLHSQDLLRKQLGFVLEMCNERWLRPTEEIWIKELVERVDQKTIIFVPASDREHMESVLKRMTFGNEFDDDLNQVRAEKEEIKERSLRLRESLVEMRQEISRKTREMKVVRKDKPSFEKIVAAQLEKFGYEILKRRLKVDSLNIHAMCRRWMENKARYPYVTAFMTGMLYAAYYAAVEHNLEIDINTQMDVEQLTYLHGVDVIVSNDRKFMKAAFETMWRDKGKRYMTTSEFISFIETS